MIVGILKEPEFETRVSLLPEAVAQLTKKGHNIVVERGAGARAAASDSDYENAGAKLASAAEVVAEADVVLSIHQPSVPVAKDKVLIGVYQPLFNQQAMQDLAAKGVTVFSLDMLPRTTRAQSMDVLSSQANIAG